MSSLEDIPLNAQSVADAAETWLMSLALVGLELFNSVVAVVLSLLDVIAMLGIFLPFIIVGAAAVWLIPYAIFANAGAVMQALSVRWHVVAFIGNGFVFFYQAVYAPVKQAATPYWNRFAYVAINVTSTLPYLICDKVPPEDLYTDCQPIVQTVQVFNQTVYAVQEIAQTYASFGNEISQAINSLMCDPTLQSTNCDMFCQFIDCGSAAPNGGSAVRGLAATLGSSGGTTPSQADADKRQWLTTYIIVRDMSDFLLNSLFPVLRIMWAFTGDMISIHLRIFGAVLRFMSKSLQVVIGTLVQMIKGQGNGAAAKAYYTRAMGQAAQSTFDDIIAAINGTSHSFVAQTASPDDDHDPTTCPNPPSKTVGCPGPFKSILLGIESVYMQIFDGLTNIVVSSIAAIDVIVCQVTHISDCFLVSLCQNLTMMVKKATVSITSFVIVCPLGPILPMLTDAGFCNETLPGIPLRCCHIQLPDLGIGQALYEQCNSSTACHCILCRTTKLPIVAFFVDRVPYNPYDDNQVCQHDGYDVSVFKDLNSAFGSPPPANTSIARPDGKQYVPLCDTTKDPNCAKKMGVQSASADSAAAARAQHFSAGDAAKLQAIIDGQARAASASWNVRDLFAPQPYASYTR